MAGPLAVGTDLTRVTVMPLLGAIHGTTRNAKSPATARQLAGWPLLRGAERLAVLILLVFAGGCSDNAGSPFAPEDPRLAMAKASVAKAQELYSLALRADSAGQVYRPMLLRALIDDLQFGAPMQSVPIRVGPDNLAFTVITQDALLTSGGVPYSSAAMLMAWRGTNAEQILVVLAPYGSGVNPAVFNTIAFYLDGDDTPRIATSGTADFRLDQPGLACVYQLATPLVGPPGQCAEERQAITLNLTFFANGDTSGSPQQIQFSRTNLNGVRVTRNAEDFSARRALALLPSR